MTFLRVASRFVSSPRVHLCAACALLPALTSAQNCPPVPQPGCNPLIPSALQCSTEEDATSQFTISTHAELLPGKGCTIVASAGSVACGALVSAGATGHTEGACGTGNCSEADADADLDGDGGDLLVMARSALASATASAGGASANSTASASVAPLSMDTSWGREFSGHRLVDVYRYAMSPPNEQFTEVVAAGEGTSIAGGGFSTAFAAGCSGFTIELSIDLEKTEHHVCSQFPAGVGCESCRSGIVSIGFVDWTVDWGSTDTIVQGVAATRVLADGTLEPIFLGAFDSPAFQADYQGDTLLTSGFRTILLSPPAGTQTVGVNTATDSFYAHDGDIDGDGRVCTSDEALMNGLVGAVLGDADYTPRADFDLDGAVTTVDLALFYEIYQPDVCGCLDADVNDDCCVNIQDYLAVLAAWGPCPSGPCAADVNGDGMVGINDLLEVLAEWDQGNCP